LTLVTQILNLPLLTFPVTIANNEDWTDSWAYIDASSNPISLAGLTLVMMVRKQAADPVLYLAASSVSGTIGGPLPAGSIVTGGDGLNVVALSISKTLVSTLAAGTYVFEMQATGEGVTRTIATGPLLVNQGIVR
jgi:hypothetical protein